MRPHPHHYRVHARTGGNGSVFVESDGVPVLRTAPPVEYDGPGDQWSPEGLLVAAAADCFVLTFRAVAAASKFTWLRLECDNEGVLDRCDGVVRFTEMHLTARLLIPAGGDLERAKHLLDKAKASCLVTRSLAFEPTLTTTVAVDGAP